MPRYDVIPGAGYRDAGAGFETCPGRVRCYDAGPRYVDRWTVLFEDMPTDAGTPPRPYGPRQALALSDNPSHPQGVSQWCECPPPQTYGKGATHRRVPFAALPERVRLHVLARLED